MINTQHEYSYLHYKNMLEFKVPSIYQWSAAQRLFSAVKPPVLVINRDNTKFRIRNVRACEKMLQRYEGILLIDVVRMVPFMFQKTKTRLELILSLYNASSTFNCMFNSSQYIFSGEPWPIFLLKLCNSLISWRKKSDGPDYSYGYAKCFLSRHNSKRHFVFYWMNLLLCPVIELRLDHIGNFQNKAVNCVIKSQYLKSFHHCHPIRPAC